MTPTATAATYPMVPMLDPRTMTESAFDFGMRAFRYLLGERGLSLLLETDTLELALLASQPIVAAREMAAPAREAIHATRLEISTTLHRRHREAAIAERVAERQAVAAAAPTTKGPGPQGALLRRPVPVLPPSGAAVRAL
jgi:hypothetical protein